MTVEDKLEAIDRKLDYMMAIEDRLLKIESNAQKRDDALRDSFGASYEIIWNYLAGINMKQLESEGDSKRIEEKLDRLLKQEGKDEEYTSE